VNGVAVLGALGLGFTFGWIAKDVIAMRPKPGEHVHTFLDDEEWETLDLYDDEADN